MAGINENIKLKNVIERFIKSPVYTEVDYVVVDDGSTDATTQIIESFRSHNIKTIRHPTRRGVGSAIRTAVTYGMDKNYDILVIMAGNDKDNPDEIPSLVEPILKEGFDLVQGSRYLKGGTAGGHMPFYRRLAVRLHSWLISLITGKKMTDSTNGFRAIRLSMFRDSRINIHQQWLDGYELEPYILYKALTLGFKVKEVAVTKIYPPKKLGYTKMRPFFGWWSILKPLVYLGLGIRK